MKLIPTARRGQRRRVDRSFPRSSFFVFSQLSLLNLDLKRSASPKVFSQLHQQTIVHTQTRLLLRMLKAIGTGTRMAQGTWTFVRNLSRVMGLPGFHLVENTTLPVTRRVWIGAPSVGQLSRAKHGYVNYDSDPSTYILQHGAWGNWTCTTVDSLRFAFWSPLLNNFAPLPPRVVC